MINLFIKLLIIRINDVIIAPSEVLFLSYDEEIYYLKRHGVKDGFMSIEIDSKLEKIATLVLSNHLVAASGENRVELSDDLDKQLRNQLEIGKKFMDGYFDLHVIQEISKNDLCNLAKETNDEKTNKLVDEYQYLVERIKELINKINPFDLKISFIKGEDDDFISCLREILIYLNNGSLLVDKNIGFIFSEIKFNLDRVDCDKIFSYYIHELAHTQLESVSGSYESYYNKEIVSIFLELVSSFEIDSKGDILRSVERQNLSTLFQGIYILKYVDLDHSVALKTSGLVVSILEAFRLFEEYQNKSNIYEKLDVMYGIQDIFDGKITVENFLVNNGINFSNSKDLGLVKKRIDFVKGK